MKREKTKNLNLFVKTVEQAIKKNCHDCNGNFKKINCGLAECPLYPYRPYAKKSVWPKFR